MTANFGNNYIYNSDTSFAELVKVSLTHGCPRLVLVIVVHRNYPYLSQGRNKLMNVKFHGLFNISHYFLPKIIIMIIFAKGGRFRILLSFMFTI